jgi:hypothetical protein
MKWMPALVLVIACGGTPTEPTTVPPPTPAGPAPVTVVDPPPPAPTTDRKAGGTVVIHADGSTTREPAAPSEVRESGLEGRIGTARGPGIEGPTLPDQKKPAGRISLTDKQSFDETTLTADAVVAKLQSAYFAGLKRCYRNYLAKDPTARGKVALALTVNETGRAIQTTAKGFSNDVDACATGLMTGWRFPIPKDRDGEPTTASFAIVLMLVPE